MSKIVIVGGSSEIGSAIASELQEEFPSALSEIIRISTSLNTPGSIFWNPESCLGVYKGLTGIVLTKGDHIIISLGALAKDDSAQSTEDKIKSIANLYNVNLVAPVLALNYFYDQLEAAGGGRIIVLTSVAAFPVLDNNFIYGSSKLALDSMAQYLQRSKKSNSTKITIVRSGFVQTKLNLGRKPTPFALSTNQVASLVVSRINQPIVWTPRIFALIAWLLQNITPLKMLANKLVGNSKS